MGMAPENQTPTVQTVPIHYHCTLHGVSRMQMGMIDFILEQFETYTIWSFCSKGAKPLTNDPCGDGNFALVGDHLRFFSRADGSKLSLL